MWADVVELRDFYRSRLGQVVRQRIGAKLRLLWPNLSGQVVVGLGYATPYLRPYREEAERVLGFMPAGQGVVHWPPEGPYAVALVDETELPLSDLSVDRLLLVHCLEAGEYLRDLLKEAWRVLAPGGRLVVVAPNRRGLWARIERTPFALGQPYSLSQLRRLLREHLFTPIQSQAALFVPPTNSRPLLRAAAAWERIGDRFFPHFSGVILLEASKQLHATIPQRRLAARRPLLGAFPVARPGPAG